MSNRKKSGDVTRYSSYTFISLSVWIYQLVNYTICTFLICNSLSIYTGFLSKIVGSEMFMCPIWDLKTSQNGFYCWKQNWYKTPIHVCLSIYLSVQYSILLSFWVHTHQSMLSVIEMTFFYDARYSIALLRPKNEVKPLTQSAAK